MQNGFPKAQRLLRRGDFSAVYKTGTPYRNAGFHLFVRPRDGSEVTRLGLTVTRAVGGAVVRNRLKRWAREFYRLNYHRLESGVDVVQNHHPSLARKSRAEFDRLLEHVWKSADPQ